MNIILLTWNHWILNYLKLIERDRELRYMTLYYVFITAIGYLVLILYPMNSLLIIENAIYLTNEVYITAAKCLQTSYYLQVLFLKLPISKSQDRFHLGFHRNNCQPAISIIQIRIRNKPNWQQKSKNR